MPIARITSFEREHDPRDEMTKWLGLDLEVPEDKAVSSTGFGNPNSDPHSAAWRTWKEVPMHTILRLPEVKTRTALSRSTIYVQVCARHVSEADQRSTSSGK